MGYQLAEGMDKKELADERLTKMPGWHGILLIVDLLEKDKDILFIGDS